MSIPEIPPGHFLDSDGRAVALVVANDTGEPAFAILDDQLIPYAEWRAQQAPPAAPPQALRLQSGDGAFAAALAIT